MIFINGSFAGAESARISPSDAGLLHGVGLFETMLGGIAGAGEGEDRAQGSAGSAGGKAWVFGLDAHLDRLVRSARELGLSQSLRPLGLRDAVLRTIERSGHGRARVRLTITGGDLNMLSRGDGARCDPTVLIAAQPATAYPDAFFEHGITCVIADLKVNPLDPMAGHKTLNYWGRLRELQRAAAKQAGEALVFQVSNHLAGGCTSNIFMAKGGRLLTPTARGEEGPGAIPSPVLPGITRAFIIERAGALGLDVERRLATIDDVLGADEVFLTNSSWGVLPVVAVEQRAIGSGEVGALTRDLRAWWEDAVEDAAGM